MIGIRDGIITSFNDSLIQTVKHTTWPELDVIKKSLDHEKIDNRLNESFDTLHNIKYYLDQYDIIGASIVIKDYKLTVSNTPELKVVLEKHKSDIIRFLLERFKNHINSIHHIIKLEFTVSDLISTGIGWPELSTIYNSVQRQRIIDMKHR